MNRFRRRYAYHTWATTQLADVLTDSKRHRAARRYLAHIAAADRVWLRRLNGQPSDDLVLWPDLDPEAIRALTRENAAHYAGYLDGRTSLDGTIIYRNSKGARFETGIADVLDHVLLHGAYHRGQTAAALRAAGDDPPVTDFIAWERAGTPGT